MCLVCFLQSTTDVINKSKFKFTGSINSFYFCIVNWFGSLTVNFDVASSYRRRFFKIIFWLTVAVIIYKLKQYWYLIKNKKFLLIKILWTLHLSHNLKLGRLTFLLFNDLINSHVELSSTTQTCALVGVCITSLLHLGWNSRPHVCIDIMYAFKSFHILENRILHFFSEYKDVWVNRDD